MTAARATKALAPAPGAVAPGAGAGAGAGAGVSRNLNGQRLGPKGRVTRERIIASAAELVAAGDGSAISLSAVARHASLGMTSVYVYFNDLTEVLLAVLEPVMEEAEAAYLGRLRHRWPDDELPERCLDFVSSYHGFWERHSKILHLRNSMADAHDERMLFQRVQATLPIIRLLVGQMDGVPSDEESATGAMASMLMTGIERAATVATDAAFPKPLRPAGGSPNAPRFQLPAARLLELGIRDRRALAEQSR